MTLMNIIFIFIISKSSIFSNAMSILVVDKCYADTECDTNTEICSVDQICVCKPGFREGVLGCASKLSI